MRLATIIKVLALFGVVLAVMVFCNTLRGQTVLLHTDDGYKKGTLEKVRVIDARKQPKPTIVYRDHIVYRYVPAPRPRQTPLRSRYVPRSPYSSVRTLRFNTFR